MFFDAVEDFVAVGLGIGFPVEAVSVVDRGDEDVDAGVSVGRDVGIGDGRVANVNGHVVRDGSFALDIGDVGAIVVGEEDVMVGGVVVDFVEPEVEHEGGAGVFFLSERVIGAGAIAHNGAHGVGVVGIDDDVIGGDFLTVFEFDRGDAGAVVVELFDGGVEADFAAFFFDDFGHGFRDFAEASLDVVDAESVFDVGEDGEEGGAFPWGHAEVFGLEGEGELEAEIVEIFVEDIDD